MISIVAESLALSPDELAALVQLEQREQRDGLGHAVLALDRLVEGEAPRAGQQRRAARRAAARGRPWDGACGWVDRRRRQQQRPHRVHEPRRLVGRAGGLERDAPQLRRQGRRAVVVGLLRCSNRACIHADAPEAAVLEQPREQLVGGLCGSRSRPSGSSHGSIRRDFSSSSAAIRIRNSVAASRSSSPRASSRSIYASTTSAR